MPNYGAFRSPARARPLASRTAEGPGPRGSPLSTIPPCGWGTSPVTPSPGPARAACWSPRFGAPGPADTLLPHRPRRLGAGPCRPHLPSWAERGGGDAAPAPATGRASLTAPPHSRPLCSRRTSTPRCPPALCAPSVRPSARCEPRRLALLSRVRAALVAAAGIRRPRHGAGRGQRAPQLPGPRRPGAAPGPRALGGRRPQPGPAELLGARAAAARGGAAAADQRERPVRRRAGGSR